MSSASYNLTTTSAEHFFFAFFHLFSNVVNLQRPKCRIICKLMHPKNLFNKNSLCIIIFLLIVFLNLGFLNDFLRTFNAGFTSGTRSVFCISASSFFRLSTFNYSMFYLVQLSFVNNDGIFNPLTVRQYEVKIIYFDRCQQRAKQCRY